LKEQDWVFLFQKGLLRCTEAEFGLNLKEEAKAPPFTLSCQSEKTIKTIRVIFKEKEIIKEAKRRFLKRGTRNPSEKEIENQIKVILKERLEEVIEKAERGAEIKIALVRGFFADEKMRREMTKVISECLESERIKWLNSIWPFNLKKFLQREGIKKKIFHFLEYFLRIPLDYFFINRYFNLLENFAKDVIEICNINLTQKEIEPILKKIEGTAREIRILEKAISAHCQTNPFYLYYHRIIEIFTEKFLYYHDIQETDEIVKKVKEII